MQDHSNIHHSPSRQGTATHLFRGRALSYQLVVHNVKLCSQRAVQRWVTIYHSELLPSLRKYVEVVPAVISRSLTNTDINSLLSSLTILPVKIRSWWSDRQTLHVNYW